MFPDVSPMAPADAAHTAITFFQTWIARIGGVVALIGMIKFALSIKSDDARESFTSLLTAVSGFIIMSYVSTAFTVTAAPAATEFQALVMFIVKWLRRVGAVTMLLGAVHFGLSIKDDNAAGKINGVRTLAAGGIVIATANLWHMFF